MLTLPPALRFYVAPEPTSMHRSFDGLSLLVSTVVKLDPMSGHVVLFFNRRGDQVKALYWDRTGYCIWQKRLARGTFKLPKTEAGQDGCVSMEASKLSLILEGIDLQGARHRPRWVPNAGESHAASKTTSSKTTSKTSNLAESIRWLSGG